MHATLVDSSIAGYERFVGPLGPDERERYYVEMQRMGTAFGIPQDLHPPTHRDFLAYLDEAIAGLRIGEESRLVAREALSPPAPLVLLPLGLLSGLLTVGLLPPRIRRGLGLRWGPGAARMFRAATATVRRTVPLLRIGCAAGPTPGRRSVGSARPLPPWPARPRSPRAAKHLEPDRCAVRLDRRLEGHGVQVRGELLAVDADDAVAGAA